MSNETLFRIAFWILIAGVLLMRVFFILRVRRAGERILPDQKAVEREGAAMLAVRTMMFLILLAVLVLYGAGSPWMQFLAIPLPDWLRAAGFFLALVGLLFWTWTQIALDTQWSAQLQMRAEHRLVTTGPYARIRHPLYTAMTGWAAGLALVTANWVFVVFAVITPAVFFLRVPREEKMMVERFGEEYQAYKKRTGMFFPKL